MGRRKTDNETREGLQGCDIGTWEENRMQFFQAL